MRDIRQQLLGELSHLTDTLELYDEQGQFNKTDCRTIFFIMQLYTAFDQFITEQETMLRYKKESKEQNEK